MYDVLSSFHSAKEVEKNPTADLEQETKESKRITMDLLLCFVLIFFVIRSMSLLSSYPLLHRASKHAMACSTKKYLALTRHFYQHIKATQLSPFHWCENQASNMVCMEQAGQGNGAVCSQALSAIHTLQKRGASVCHALRGQGRGGGERGTKNITPWGLSFLLS